MHTSTVGSQTMCAGKGLPTLLAPDLVEISIVDIQRAHLHTIRDTNITFLTALAPKEPFH